MSPEYLKERNTLIKEILDRADKGRQLAFLQNKGYSPYRKNGKGFAPFEELLSMGQKQNDPEIERIVLSLMAQINDSTVKEFVNGKFSNPVVKAPEDSAIETLLLKNIDNLDTLTTLFNFANAKHVFSHRHEQTIYKPKLHEQLFYKIEQKFNQLSSEGSFCDTPYYKWSFFYTSSIDKYEAQPMKVKLKERAWQNLNKAINSISSAEERYNELKGLLEDIPKSFDKSQSPFIKTEKKAYNTVFAQMLKMNLDDTIFDAHKRFDNLCKLRANPHTAKDDKKITDYFKKYIKSLGTNEQKLKAWEATTNYFSDKIFKKFNDYADLQAERLKRIIHENRPKPKRLNLDDFLSDFTNG